MCNFTEVHKRIYSQKNKMKTCMETQRLQIAEALQRKENRVFLSIVLWPRMTHLVPMLSQNACCG